jgi:cytosine/uracil/thiamine/allantoin permease
MANVLILGFCVYLMRKLSVWINVCALLAYALILIWVLSKIFLNNAASMMQKN